VFFSILFFCSSEAGEYPEKPITIICPFSPGGGSDLNARILQPHIEKVLGQQVLITYKTGAGGILGINQFVTMKPDGYTLAVYNLPHHVLRTRFGATTFGLWDIVPLIAAVFKPEAILVRKDSSFKSLNDLVDYAKKNPGKITAGNTGVLSVNHLTTALLQKNAGIELTRVIFDGGAKSMAALLGGHTDVMVANTGIWVRNKENTRMLAVAAEERVDIAPDVPTFEELGYSNVKNSVVLLVYALKETHPPALNLLKEKFASLCTDGSLRRDYDVKSIPIRFPFYDSKKCVDYTRNLWKRLADVGSLLVKEGKK